MKTAGKIFSTIGGILSLVSGALMVLGSVLLFCLVIPSVHESLYALLEKIADQTNFPIMSFVDYLLPIAIISAIFALISAVLYFIAGAISLKAHQKDRYIPAIVLGAIAGFQVFIILGAIFGLIFKNKNQRQ